jgi:hypothetical protein
LRNVCDPATYPVIKNLVVQLVAGNFNVLWQRRQLIDLMKTINNLEVFGNYRETKILPFFVDDPFQVKKK